jgi:AAA+ superfamily predicted ATPase
VFLISITGADVPICGGRQARDRDNRFVVDIRWSPEMVSNDWRMLVVMTGLPGTGKTAVAEAVARALPAPVFSVDPIEGSAAGRHRS